MPITPTTTDECLAELKQILVDRRVEIHTAINRRKWSGREGRTPKVSDVIDVTDASIEEEMSFALLEMRTTTLARVDAALARLAAGSYGACVECGESIAIGRLRALPFAVRCRDCEAHVESELLRLQQRRTRADSGTVLVPEVRSL